MVGWYFIEERRTFSHSGEEETFPQFLKKLTHFKRKQNNLVIQHSLYFNKIRCVETLLSSNDFLNPALPRDIYLIPNSLFQLTATLIVQLKILPVAASYFVLSQAMVPLRPYRRVSGRLVGEGVSRFQLI